MQDCWRRKEHRVPGIGTGIAAAHVGTDPAKPDSSRLALLQSERTDEWRLNRATCLWWRASAR